MEEIYETSSTSVLSLIVVLCFFDLSNNLERKWSYSVVFMLYLQGQCPFFRHTVLIVNLFSSQIQHKYWLLLNNNQYDSSELGEELCPVSSFLPLRVHKVYIRVSFSDTFLRWLPPSVTNNCHYQQRKNIPFYTLLGSGCVLISYSMLSLIIAWLG
jgi:hypothetical protein